MYCKDMIKTCKTPFIPQTVWPDLGSYVRVKARCSFEVVSAMGGKSDDPCSTKAPSLPFSKEVSRERLPGDLSRNPLVTFGLSDRSGCGAVLIFRSPALIAVWCSFSARSRSPGLSDRSHCGAVLIFSALAQPRFVGSLSLRCGAHFQRARAAQACRIALIAVRCSFSARSRNPLSTLGLSDHSRCGAVFLLIVEEILRRDLDQEVF